MNSSSPIRTAFASVALPLLVAVGVFCQPMSAAAQQADKLPFASTVTGVDVLPGTYALAPGDVLDIGVEGQTDYTRTVTIVPDGTINYFGVGTVMAAGRTVEQLRRTLTKGLLGQFRRPHVVITIHESHALKVSVLGAVHTEGQVNYRPGMRLLEAVGEAGGLKQQAELTQATLVSDGGTQSRPIDMTRLIVGHDMALNMPLKPGDLVLVSPRDPEVAQVQVIGQVTKPGAYPVPPAGATVEDVLSLASGPTEKAALTQVQILHAGQARTVDLHPLLFNINDPVGSTRVVAGDVVNVPLNNRKIAVVGEVHLPQVYTIPDGEKWTVFTALTMAGGPTYDGDKKRVAIVRTGANGQLQTTSVNVDNLLRAKRGATDPPLQPGDILVIPKRNQPFNALTALQTGVGTLLGLSALRNVGHF